VKRLPIALALLAVAGSTVPAGGQEIPRFRVGIDAVSVDVRVTRDGRAVKGLGVANFELLDSGVPQKIAAISLEGVPLHLLLALDTSSSVAGERLAALLDAVQAVTASLGPDDRVTLLTFADEVRLLAGPATEAQEANRSLLRAVAQGSTSLHDALLDALVLRDADARRPLLVVFSDGEDTASWVPADAIVQEARRSDTVVYAVTPKPADLPDDPEDPQLRAALKTWFDAEPQLARNALLLTLARETGGRLLYTAPSRDLRAAFLEIISEFRNRYLLSYTPDGVPADGWHPITVRLKGASGDVTARSGYLR